MKERIKKLLGLLTLEVLAVLLLFAACVFIFVRIADENVLEHNYAFDTRVSHWVAMHRTESLINFMRIITFFGSHLFLFPAYIVIILLLIWKKKYSYAIYLFVIAATSTAAMFFIKEIFKRERPSEVVYKLLGNYSFPSGHSVSSFIFFSVLAYFVSRRPWKMHWKFLIIFFLLLFCLTIGYSRLVLNVHYATDVIAGFCFGVVWVTISIFIMKKIMKTSEL